ncbi:hypothetical protein [Aliarcobacter butzleri]
MLVFGRLIVISSPLSTFLKNIRIKLGDNGANPKYLLTEYGVGYKLVF